MWTSPRNMPMPASNRSRSFPAWPTNGTPCLSSWKPGASPTNMRSARALPAPKTTCVRPCARRQRVQPAAESAYACSSSRESTGTALTRGTLCLEPDGDDPGFPGAARRLDADLVALLAAENCTPDGRLGRDASDARDLDGHELTVLALELDG